MNLTLDALVEGDTALVSCGGQIVHGATARRSRACIGRLLRRCRRVVLDLGAVTDIDARGVGTLAVLIAHARSTGRRLILARSSRRVDRVLRLTGLDAQFDTVSEGRDTGRSPLTPRYARQPGYGAMVNTEPV